MIPYIAAAAISAALAAGGAWQYQANKYERLLSEQRTEYATAQVRALEIAHAETLRLQGQASKAAAATATRVQRLSADRDKLRAAADGLRGDLSAAAHRLPSATCDSTRAYAATITELLGTMEAAGGAIADQADGHAIDSMRCDQ